MRETVLTLKGMTGNLLLRTRFQLENEFVFRPKHDPDKPPPVKPGDIYIVIGAVIGIVIGITIGLSLSCLANIGNIFFPLVIGVIVGGIGGSYMGEWLKNRVARQRLKRWEQIFKKAEKDLEAKTPPKNT
jgi:hypothetical protein